MASKYQRRHYEELAQLLRLQRGAFVPIGLSGREGADRTIAELASQLGDIFASDNPRFDRERFEAAVNRPI